MMSTSQKSATLKVKETRGSPDASSSPMPLLKTRQYIGYYLFPGSRGIRTRRVGLATFLKGGAHVDLAEAEAMRYVAAYTSIPVPNVLKAWQSGGATYITMGFIEGVELQSAWQGMSRETKTRVIAQLKDYVAQLRRLSPPYPGIVAAIDGGPLRDNGRVGLGKFGPFEDHDSFHYFLRTDKAAERFKLFPRGPQILSAHRRKFETKFTHGDLAPRNILVNKDGTVTGILDWDCAGWFPEYWEYTKAHFSPRMPLDWIDSIGMITGRYDEQLDGERALYEICGCMIT